MSRSWVPRILVAGFIVALFAGSLWLVGQIIETATLLKLS